MDPLSSSPGTSTLDSSTPIVSSDYVTNLRKTQDDSTIAHNLFQTDPKFADLTNKYLPLIQKQDPTGWRDRLPTLALNDYYNIDPSVEMDKSTAALANNMTNPNPPQPPWLHNSNFMNTTNSNVVQNFQKAPTNWFDKIASSILPGFMTDSGPNLAQRIGTDQQYGETGQTSPTGMTNILSNLVGGVGDVGGEVLKSAGSILPKFISEGIGLVAKDLGAPEALQNLTGAYQQWSAKHPEAAADLGLLGNYAKAGATTYGVQALGDQVAGGLKQGAQQMKGAIQDTSSGPLFRQQPPEEKLQELNSTVGKIVQGDTKSIASAKQALSQIDTRGVQTYDDLNGAIQDRLDTLRTAQDSILEKNPERVPLSEFTKTVSKGSVAASSNPVEQALGHLQELYAKTGDTENYVRIKSLADDAAENGLSAKAVNDLSREYGSEFGSKAFNPRTGDPLTSVNARLYENVRSSLKDASRSLLPDATSETIDDQMSSLLDTKQNVEKMAEKVNALSQKVGTRGFVERAARLVGKGLDMATFHGLRGFMQSFFPSNVGLKAMNSLQIQDALSTNLSRFSKLIDEVPLMSDQEAASAINQFVTETHTGPIAAQQATLGTTVPESPASSPTTVRGEVTAASPPTVQQTSPPVNSPKGLPPAGGLSPTDPMAFKTAIAPWQLKYPDSLDNYSTEFYANNKNLLTDDGQIGSSITPDHEIVSVFNKSGIKGAGKQAVTQAIDEGGDHLMALKPLEKYYQEFGFVTEKQATNLISGKPDVVWMRLDPQAYEHYQTTSDLPIGGQDSLGEGIHQVIYDGSAGRNGPGNSASDGGIGRESTLGQIDSSTGTPGGEMQAASTQSLSSYSRSQAMTDLKAGKTVDLPLDEINVDPKHLELARKGLAAGDTGQDTGPVQVQIVGKKINLINGYGRYQKASASGQSSIPAIHLPK
jgi:hypothetical protein